MRTQSNFQDRDGIHFGISWLDRWGIKPPYVPALSLHVAQAASYSPKSSETCIKIGGVRCLFLASIQEWWNAFNENVLHMFNEYVQKSCNKWGWWEHLQPFKLRIFCFFVFDCPQHLVLFEWSKCSQRRLGKMFCPMPRPNFSIWVFPKIGIPQNGWWKSWKTLLKWMIWGENPLFLETSICFSVDLQLLSFSLWAKLSGHVRKHQSAFREYYRNVSLKSTGKLT